MRSFLRFSLFAFFALSTVLVFAQAKDTAKAKAKVGGPYLLINGEWELLSLRRLPADSFRIVYPNKIPSLLLQADKQMASGQTGCNRFQGKATLTKDSVSFKQPMAMTMMACPGQGEKYFTQALQAVNKYAFKGGYLVMYQNSKEIMRFKRITTPSQPVKK